MFKLLCCKDNEYRKATDLKSLLLISFIFITVILFSSCNVLDSSQENLILKPKSSEMEAQIKNKMTDTEASDLAYVYSERGKYQNSINYLDLDNDGSNEILVTYRSALAHQQFGNTANMCIFKQINGELVLYFDIIGSGTEIDKYDICDFNNDGLMEIAIGYISSQNGYRVFSLINLDFENKRYTDEYPSKYTDYIVTDLSTPGLQNLILVNYDTLNGFAYARLVKYDVNTGEIKVFAEDTLVYSSKYYRMSEGKNADGSNAIFISAKRGSLLSSTEILLMNDVKGQLVNVSRSEQTDEFKVKDEYISLGYYLAQDINKDGIVEIPVCNELDEDKVTDEMQQGHQLIKYKYDWYQYNDGLKKIFSSYINEDQSYILKIKDTWDFANVSCYKDYKNDLMFFYTDKGIDSENKKLLFTIKQTAEEPENKEIELNYISENNTYYILEVNSLIRDDLKYLVPSRDDLKAALYFTNIIIQKDNT